GANEVRIAYGLRDRVSDREKRYITMLYDREVTGNLQKEMQTLEAWLQIYPRDTDAMAIVGGWAAQGTGQYERGIQAGDSVLRLDPNMTFGLPSRSIIFLWTGSQRPRTYCAGRRSADSNFRKCWSLVTILRFSGTTWRECSGKSLALRENL